MIDLPTYYRAALPPEEPTACDRPCCRREGTTRVDHGRSWRIVCDHHLTAVECDGCRKPTPRYQLASSGNGQGGDGTFCADCLGWDPREDW